MTVACFFNGILKQQLINDASNVLFGADVPLSFNQKINHGTRNKEGSKCNQDLKIELQIEKNDSNLGSE